MLTKLSAVNEMLMAIRQAPVTSLSDPSNLNASLASNALDSMTGEALMRGWHCNTRKEVELEIDSNGYIHLPEETLAVSWSDPYACENADNPITIRGGKLFSIADNTDIWEESQTLNLIVELEFEDIPPALRQYIKAAAKVRFYRDLRGEPDPSLLREEGTALVMANQDDLRNKNLNLYRNNYIANQIVGRRVNNARRY